VDAPRSLCRSRFWQGLQVVFVARLGGAGAAGPRWLVSDWVASDWVARDWWPWTGSQGLAARVSAASMWSPFGRAVEHVGGWSRFDSLCGFHLGKMGYRSGGEWSGQGERPR